MENTLRYSVTVQFDVDAGDTHTLEDRLSTLEAVGAITQIKAKSSGKPKLIKQQEHE